MKRPGRTFRYVDGWLAESLARDFRIPLGGSSAGEFRFGITTPVVVEQKIARTRDGRSATDPETLDRIVRKLRKSGQLRVDRPQRPENFWREDHDGWYVQEHLTATPVTLPKTEKTTTVRAREVPLRIWVCPPLLPLAPRRDPSDATGSFVFLVQELGNFQWQGGSQISGISSLRLAVEVAGTQATWEEIRALPPVDDRFSERVVEDPIAKLRGIGGEVGVPRRIRTVYKIAYMNDEQGWHFDREFLRVNDILAYPLYIAST
jgi:hypothetical protein